MKSLPICSANRLIPSLLATAFFQAGVLSASEDLVTPEMVDEEPGAGRCVRQVSPEYRATKVYHALYLPTNWKPGGSFPVIVEYTGNKWIKCGSSGEVKDANLAYGLTGGRDFICVSMPYIDNDGQANAHLWWGDRQATVEYCKTNLPRICRHFGGDPNRVFICGFSRGAIAASYIGLADDEIAALWKGMFAHDHFDGHKEWSYPESSRQAALERLARLRGRPVFVSSGTEELANDGPEGFLRAHLNLANFTFLKVPVAEIFSIPDGGVIHPHTDLWMHRESAYRDFARAWLHQHQ